MVYLTHAGASASTITTNIRQGDSSTNDNIIRVRDIVNARQKIRLELLAGQTPVQAILTELRDNLFAYAFDTDIEGRLCRLFFALPQSLATFMRSPEVLLLDCTYNTNRFKLPLLNMVGINGLGQTFYVAYAFLRSESESDLRWALRNFLSHATDAPRLAGTDCDLALINALDGLFSSSAFVLCQWHVFRSVRIWARRYFSRARPLANTLPDGQEEAGPTPSDRNQAGELLQCWKLVVKSPRTHTFTTRSLNLKQKYHEQPDVVRYMEETWLP